MYDRSKFATLRRLLLSEYYVASLLMVTAYAWLRWAYSDVEIQIKPLYKFNAHSSVIRDSFGTWEWRVLIALSATAAYRIYKATNSTHGACFTAVGFAQLFVAVMAFLVNPTICGLYVTACALCFLLLEQPQMEQPREIEALTPVVLKSIKDAATADPGIAYLVFLHAPWSLTCRHTFSIFADLSTCYTTERLRFRKLDVGEWPHVAHQLGVEVSAGNSQLPTIILYESGKEVARLPQRLSTAGHELTKGNIIYSFELDMRLATSAHQPWSSDDADKEAKEAGQQGSEAKKKQ